MSIHHASVDGESFSSGKGDDDVIQLDKDAEVVVVSEYLDAATDSDSSESSHSDDEEDSIEEMDCGGGDDKDGL